MVNMDIDCVEICRSTRCGKCRMGAARGIRITLGAIPFSDFKALALAAQTTVENHVRNIVMETDGCRRVRRGDVPIHVMKDAN